MASDKLTSELKKEINGLIEVANKSGNVASAGRRILDSLRDAGITLKVPQLDPRMLCVHRQNRDGLGVSWVRVHKLLDDVLDVGFTFSAVEVIATEVCDEDIAFNKKLMEQAGGKLGELSGMERFASLLGSHTNFMLRAIVGNVPHEHESSKDITSDGKLDLAKCMAVDRILHDACTKGLEVTIVPLWLVKEMPAIPDLLQKLGNTKLEGGEPEFQVIWRIWTYISSAEIANGYHTFEDIKARIMASKPACKASIPSMYQFARKFAGDGGHALKTVVDTAYNHAPHDRTLCSTLMQQLSETGKLPYLLLNVRHGLLLAAYMHNCVTASHLKLVLAKEFTATAKNVDAFMVKLEAKVPKDAKNNFKVRELLALANMHEVLNVCNIKIKTGQRFQNTNDVGHWYCTELGQITSCNIENEFTAPSHAEAPVHASHAEARLWTQASSVELQLQEKGFKAGIVVEKKAEGGPLRGNFVKLLNDNNAEVVLTTGLSLEVPVSELLDDVWNISSSSVADVIKDIVCKPMALMSGVDVACARSRLTLELVKWSSDVMSQDHVEVKAVGTKKEVHSLEHFQKNKLVLVPSTIRFTHIADMKSSKATHIAMCKSICFSMSQMTDDISPFFVVGAPQRDDKAANMIMKVRTIDDMKFPYMTNQVVLKPGDKLLLDNTTCKRKLVDDSAPASKAKAKAKAKAKVAVS